MKGHRLEDLLKEGYKIVETPISTYAVKELAGKYIILKRKEDGLFYSIPNKIR